jgi:hypothetical protein
MDMNAELLVLYRAAPNDCKATILLALAALDESALIALFENAPAERRQIVLTLARDLTHRTESSSEAAL